MIKSRVMLIIQPLDSWALDNPWIESLHALVQQMMCIFRKSDEAIVCGRTVVKSRCGEDAARFALKNSENGNKRLYAYLKCAIG